MTARTYISRNGLTPRENREIGSLARAFFLLGTLFIFLKFFGFNAFEEPFLYIAEIAAYFLAGTFLRWIKVWVY